MLQHALSKIPSRENCVMLCDFNAWVVQGKRKIKGVM